MHIISRRVVHVFTVLVGSHEAISSSFGEVASSSLAFKLTSCSIQSGREVGRAVCAREVEL